MLLITLSFICCFVWRCLLRLLLFATPNFFTSSLGPLLAECLISHDLTKDVFRYLLSVASSWEMYSSYPQTPRFSVRDSSTKPLPFSLPLLFLLHPPSHIGLTYIALKNGNNRSRSQPRQTQENRNRHRLNGLERTSSGRRSRKVQELGDKSRSFP